MNDAAGSGHSPRRRMPQPPSMAASDVGQVNHTDELRAMVRESLCDKVAPYPSVAWEQQGQLEAAMMSPLQSGHPSWGSPAGRHLAMPLDVQSRLAAQYYANSWDQSMPARPSSFEQLQSARPRYSYDAHASIPRQPNDVRSQQDHIAQLSHVLEYLTVGPGATSAPGGTSGAGWHPHPQSHGSGGHHHIPTPAAAPQSWSTYDAPPHQQPVHPPPHRSSSSFEHVRPLDAHHTAQSWPVQVPPELARRDSQLQNMLPVRHNSYSDWPQTPQAVQSARSFAGNNAGGGEPRPRSWQQQSGQGNSRRSNLAISDLRRLRAVLETCRPGTGEVAAALTSTTFPLRIQGLTAMMGRLTRRDAWQLSLEIFFALPTINLKQDSIAYNAALAACVNGKQWHMAMDLLCSMSSQSVDFDSGTVHIVLAPHHMRSNPSVAAEMVVCLYNLKAPKNILLPEVTSLIAELFNVGKGTLGERIALLVLSEHRAFTPLRTLPSDTSNLSADELRSWRLLGQQLLQAEYRYIQSAPPWQLPSGGKSRGSPDAPMSSGSTNPAHASICTSAPSTSSSMPSFTTISFEERHLGTLPGLMPALSSGDAPVPRRSDVGRHGAPPPAGLESGPGEPGKHSDLRPSAIDDGSGGGGAPLPGSSPSLGLSTEEAHLHALELYRMPHSVPKVQLTSEEQKLAHMLLSAYWSSGQTERASILAQILGYA